MRSIEALEQKLKPFGKAISISPFIVAIVCALLFKVASIFLRADISMGFVLVIAGTWILANYFFEIIEHRAVGSAQWPVLSIDTLFSFRRQLGLLFAAIAVAVLLVRYAIDAAGLRSMARLFGAMVALVLPVSAAILAVTKSPLRAIDPVRLLVAAARMEIGFIIILIVSFAVWLLANRAAVTGTIALFLLTTYSYLLLGYVIGSVVYARRSALGVRTTRAPEDVVAAAQRELVRERRKALNHAYGFAARGNINGALAHIAAYVRSEPDPLAAEVWLFQEMTQWEDPQAALQMGRLLPDRLAAAGRERQAAKVAAVRDFIAERVMSDAGTDSGAQA